MVALSDSSLSSALQPAAIVLAAFKRATRRQAVAQIFRSIPRQHLFRLGGGTVVALALLAIGASNFFGSQWVSAFSFFGTLALMIWGAVFFRRTCLLAGLSTDMRGLADAFGFQQYFRRYLVFRAELERKKLGLDDVRKARRTLEKYRELSAVSSPLKDPGMSFFIALITGIVIALSVHQKMIETGYVALVLVVLLVCAYFYGLVSVLLFNGAERQLELEIFLIWYEEERSYTVARERYVCRAEDSTPVCSV